MKKKPTRTGYLIILSAAAMLILVIGSYLRPKQAPRPVVSENERARLQEASERRDLERTGEKLYERALRLAPHVLWIGPANRSGVLWQSRNHVLTSGPVRPRSSAAASLLLGGLLISELRVDVGQDGVTPKIRLPPLQPGEWLMTVTRTNSGSFVFSRGVFTGTAGFDCGASGQIRGVVLDVPLGAAFAGGGLFDLDNQLAAFAVRCGDSVVGIPVSDLSAVLADIRSLGGQLLYRWGFSVEMREDDVPVVTRVLDGTFAAQSGLQKGDALVSLDGASLNGPASLAPLVQGSNGSAWKIVVARQNRRVSLTLEDAAP